MVSGSIYAEFYLVLWFYGSRVLFGSMVLWFYGSILWFYGSIWFYGSMVLWFYGSMVYISMQASDGYVVRSRDMRIAIS